MTQLAVDIRGRCVKEIFCLEHELVEISSSLKSSLEVVSVFEFKIG